jgi:hypothetical protein
VVVVLVYRFSEEENLAVKARLNMLLGAKEYDRLFLGFECGNILGDIAHVYAGSDYLAGRIDSDYTLHIAIAIESVIRRPVKRVNVLPRTYMNPLAGL